MNKLIIRVLVLFYYTFYIFNSAFSQNSPYYHQVFSATSSDGLNWDKQNVLLLDHYSVPGAVTDTNGTIFLYAVYFASTSATEALMVASSTDGITFSGTQGVNITGSTVTKRVDPTATLLPDGSIRVFYLDFDTQPTQYIHSATSTDGINFTEDAGIRFTKESITDPDVFLMGDSIWVMYVSCWANGLELIRATSTDGLTFTEDTSFSFNDGGICATFQFDSIYRTYYCGSDGIKSAASTDSKNLLTETGTRITQSSICDPTVTRLTDSTYIMYYKYISPASGIEETENIEPSLNIYPSPMNDYATLVIKDEFLTTDLKFALYDLSGKKVFYTRIRNAQTTLNRKNLMAGTYIYSLRSDNAVVSTGKLIIQ